MSRRCSKGFESARLLEVCEMRLMRALSFKDKYDVILANFGDPGYLEASFPSKKLNGTFQQDRP